MHPTRRFHHHGGNGGGASAEALPRPEHLPVAADGEGCLEILAHRLRERPGIVAIEADFSENTLTVRYRPALVTPDELNALADDVGTLFSQRVTACEKRESIDACEACALRLGRLDPGSAAEFRASATRGRISLVRHELPVDSVEVVRPLTHKPWGARLTHEEQEERSQGRSMAVLTGSCLVFLVAAVVGGWYTARSTFAALRRLEFDVNLLMLLAGAGAAAIGYTAEAAV